MKVVYVTMQFPVASEAFAAVEIRALRRLGAEVSVLTYRGAAKDAEAMLAERGLSALEIEHGGPGAFLRGLGEAAKRPADSIWLAGIVIAHCWRRPGQLLKALALVPASFALLKTLERRRPDVIHLFWGHYPSLAGLLARRRLPTAVISLFLGAYDLERRFPLSALLARRADLLLTHADANRPALQAFGLPGDGIRTAYRGVDVPAPLPVPRKTQGLTVAAERLVPQKHTADVLRVFAALHRDLPAARLVVCGSGPELPRLQDLAQELGIAAAVRFPGHLPHHALLDLLDQAEVVVTMSHSLSERLPNILKEAMLRQCLCLSTRTAGIEELIEDGVSGILVAYGDVETAAARLKGVLADPRATERMIAAGQAKIAHEFDVDLLMAERLRQWSALCNTGRAGEAA